MLKFSIEQPIFARAILDDPDTEWVKDFVEVFGQDGKPLVYIGNIPEGSEEIEKFEIAFLRFMLDEKCLKAFPRRYAFVYFENGQEGFDISINGLYCISCRQIMEQ